MKARKGRPFDGATKANVNLNVRAEPRQIAAWKLAAAAENKTLSACVKRALDQWSAPWRKGEGKHYLAFLAAGSALVLWFFVELTS